MLGLIATLKGLFMRFLIVLLVFFPFLASCATSPVSGKTILTGGLDPREEEAIGYKAHAATLREHGVNDNKKLNQMVAGIVVRLAPHIERRDIKWTVTVLDTDEINAMAMPGGYIYFSRGLLNLFQNEAQIAAVVGHEMAHVSARHTAQRLGQTQIAALAVEVVATAAAIGTGMSPDGIRNIGGTGAGLALNAYSRDHEREADALGVKYMVAAGYDPRQAAEAFRIIHNTDVFAKKTGRDMDVPLIFRTHPESPERMLNTEKLAAALGVPKNATVNRAGYLRAIDGNDYGDAAKQGYVSNGMFIHPKMHIRFRAPDGFLIENRPDAVVAHSADKTFEMIFNTARGNTDDPMDFMTHSWLGRDAKQQDIKPVTINGLKGAMVDVFQTNDYGFGKRHVRGVVLASGIKKRMFLLQFSAPYDQWVEVEEKFRKAAQSFVFDPRGAARRPRIRAVPVRAGDTVQSLAAKMPVDDFAVDRFCLLNDITPDTKLVTGDLIKIVSIE